jgi:hypothetical protein
MKSAVIVLRVSPEEKAQFTAEAKKHKVSLSMWIACHLLEACEKGGKLAMAEIAKPASKPILTGQLSTETASAGKCIYCYSHQTESVFIKDGHYAVCSKHKPK